MSMLYVPLDRIVDNRFQARSDYGPVEELARAIRQAEPLFPDTVGLMQIPRGRLLRLEDGDPPGWVPAERPEIIDLRDGTAEDWNSHQVELAYGHRRLRAFRLLAEEDRAFAFLPVEVEVLDDELMLDSVWSENTDRQDLSAVDQAALLRVKLERIKENGGSQRDLAEAWGLDRSTISHRLRLLELPEEIQAANRSGQLPERKARRLGTVAQLAAVAPEGVKWSDRKTPGDPWAAPLSPQAYLEHVVTSPEEVSGADIRNYTRRAIDHAGHHIPRGIATTELSTVAGVAITGVVRPLCRGCPLRIHESCMERPAQGHNSDPEPDSCLGLKKRRWGQLQVEAAVADLDYPAAEDPQEISRYESYDQVALLDRIHRAGGCGHLVLGWRDSGRHARPYEEPGSYWTSGSDPYVDAPRSGIVLGHVGRLFDECVAIGQAPEELAEEEEPEDQPAWEIIMAWKKRSWAILDERRDRFDDLVADWIFNDPGRVQTLSLLRALVLPLKQTDGILLPEEHRKTAKKMATWLRQKGRGETWAPYAMDGLATLQELLDRAGVMSWWERIQDPDQEVEVIETVIPVLAWWWEKTRYHCDLETAELGVAHLHNVAQLFDLIPEEERLEETAALWPEVERAQRSAIARLEALQEEHLARQERLEAEEIRERAELRERARELDQELEEELGP